MSIRKRTEPWTGHPREPDEFQHLRQQGQHDLALDRWHHCSDRPVDGWYMATAERFRPRNVSMTLEHLVS
jgi:hypothetical protein